MKYSQVVVWLVKLPKSQRPAGIFELNTSNEIVIKEGTSLLQCCREYNLNLYKQLKDPRCVKSLPDMEVHDGGVYHRYCGTVRTSKYLR